MTSNSPSRILALVASFCSISGITLLSAINYLSIQGGAPVSLPGSPFLWRVVIPLAAVASLLWMSTALLSTIRALKGRELTPRNRAATSRGFASNTIRSLRVFAGDLSWFNDDLPTYRDLRRRGVDIRVLTYDRDSAAVQAGKAHGIQFALNPQQRSSSLRASIADAEEENESRALVVRKRTSRSNISTAPGYNYWIKVYRGPHDYPSSRAWRPYSITSTRQPRQSSRLPRMPCPIGPLPGGFCDPLWQR
jgi:hypothetical protein